MTRKSRIQQILEENLNPDLLEVINNSHLHAGHSGDNGTNETHYLIKIKSPKFDNLSRINSHKLINNALDQEFETGLHALEIKIIK